jgi:hypothetical protein
MNLIAQFTGEAARKEALVTPPFGPGLPAEVAAATATLEVHGSGFNDPGGDYCEFRALDSQGNLIATKRLEGY